MSGGSTEVIRVAGLRKRYAGGFLAVDGLDLGVDAGQICGLLGPNGAGKTTTLRMLLGLIRPTAGTVELFGNPMRPGHPVLLRVGSMVEEPAFVPHLSGIANLRLWWESNGARWSDAAVDDALAIAGLGDHVERKVKAYSHGMRQRLGLARTLLGRPDLLVLDEPSNGLDPGEMREIRDLIRRLAERGASILLSSHLLSEVEQVCSHVVVMDRGHGVAAGTVAELIGAASSAYLEVDDVPTAERVLATLPGVHNVRPEPPGLAVELDGTARRTVVAALVAAGVGVDTVTSRHRLEDAFLGLLEEEHA